MSPLEPETLSGRVLTSLTEVEQSAEAWESLRIQCSASGFISAHLLTAWLRNIGTDHRPFVVVIEDAGGGLRAAASSARDNTSSATSGSKLNTCHSARFCAL